MRRRQSRRAGPAASELSSRAARHRAATRRARRRRTGEGCNIAKRRQAIAGIVAVEARRGKRPQNGIPLLQRGLQRFARQKPVGH